MRLTTANTKALAIEHTNCSRCGGTGQFVWGAIINGRPTHSGTCYRCGGCRHDPRCKPCVTIRKAEAAARVAGNAYGLAHPKKDDDAFRAAVTAFHTEIGWPIEVNRKQIVIEAFRTGMREGRRCAALPA